MGDKMKKLRDKLTRIVPGYGWIPLLVAVTFNLTVYFVSRIIAGEWVHHNIESRFDKLIPLVPPTVAIYLGCYLFWIVNYMLIACQNKKEVCQFFAGDFISRIICFICYLAYPTTNTRPALGANGFWEQVMGGLYAVDAADNLFPSIHCLVSWFCFIGLLGKKTVPFWYKAASFIMASLVCISTLTTKQHVILDVIGGVLLAEVCLRIGRIPKVWKAYEKVLNKVNRRLHLEGENNLCSQIRN